MATSYAELTVIEPVLDKTKSVAEIEVTSDDKVTNATANFANGVKIKNALENKDNSLQITVTNSGSAGKVYVEPSDTYPNTCLGRQEINVGANATKVFMLHDISRFENKDKSVILKFTTGFTGSVYAVAKHAGIRALPTT